jgi:hypothetical protein
MGLGVFGRFKSVPKVNNRTPISYLSSRIKFEKRDKIDN